MSRSNAHIHRDELGLPRYCWHHCRNLLTNWQFWAGLTLGFPLEHLLWERVPPFDMITRWLGL